MLPRVGSFQYKRRTGHCYRPQRSWGKVIFSQACDILFTGGVPGPGGGGAWSGGVHGPRGVPGPEGGGAWSRVGTWSWGGWCMVPGGGAWSQGGVWSWGVHGGDPPGRLLLPAVRILLECILVQSSWSSLPYGLVTCDLRNYCDCVDDCLNHFLYCNRNSLTNNKRKCAPYNSTGYYSTISSCNRRNLVIRRCDYTFTRLFFLLHYK